MYITSVKESVQVQREMEIIDYGQSLSELMYSQATNYNDFPTEYGNLNDVTNPATRLNYETKTGGMLYATIQISPEKPLILGEKGRVATITIFEKNNGEYIQKGRFFAAITPM
ncbi:MAG TPA: hypothetical protein VFG39_06850 [Balneolaceae bacterium]|nr:hypothetical protein [Balneolaceae bacterium]